MTKKILILYSGGLDSFILHHYAKVTQPDAEVISVFYAHGQPGLRKELRRMPNFVELKHVDWLDEKITPVPMKSKPQEGAIFIPGRNMVFITLAACQYLPDEIWMGSVANEVSDASTDKNAKFVDGITDLLNYVLRDFQNVQVKIPFVENGWGKRECIQWALDNGLSKEDIRNTTSCYDETHLVCGKCIQCLRRWALFAELGIEEEDYNEHPRDSQMLADILEDKSPKAQFYHDEIIPHALEDRLRRTKRS